VYCPRSFVRAQICTSDRDSTIAPAKGYGTEPVRSTGAQESKSHSHGRPPIISRAAAAAMPQVPWLVSQLRDLVTAVSNDNEIHYANL
jgi:hypothetical protein